MFERKADKLVREERVKNEYVYRAIALREKRRRQRARDEYLAQYQQAFEANLLRLMEEHGEA